jgi:AAA domain/CHC2 zinc finger
MMNGKSYPGNGYDNSHSFDALATRARSVPIEDEIARRGIRLRGKNERCGPCPKCGGNDRFSINVAKQVFNCRGCETGGDVIDLVGHLDGVDFVTACSTLVNDPPPKVRPTNTLIAAKPRFVCAYDYRDEAGDLHFQVVRYQPKAFMQRRPGTKAGEWIWNLDGVRRVLYRLPEIIEAVANGYVVCLVEGEKDADNLWALNIPATTCPGGAGKWREEFNETLRDADVLLIPDNDKPGRDGFDRIGAALTGIAKHVWILDLPKVWRACPPKGDVSNWIEAGGTVEELWKLIDKAPLWSPAQTARDQQARNVEPWRAGMITARDLCSKQFPDLKFLVPGIIPEGLTIAAGRPKIGKSWFLYLLGIAVANGVEALGVYYGITKPLKGNVLYLALEDGQRRLQRRMTKLIGINPENWPKALELKTDWRPFDQGGIDDIRAWHKSVDDQGGNPTLIMIDTLAKVRAPGSPKASPYQNDHDALAALQKLSDELGLFIIVSHHDRKMDADDVYDTVSGTLGLTGAVDTILILTKKQDVRALHVRGRDIEEDTSLEMKFGKEDCKWSVVGTLAEQQAVRVSSERTAILDALAGVDSDGLAVPEIMAATGSRNRNATDILLFKMREAGEIVRVKRGVYAHPEKVGKKERKDRKKERNDSQVIENPNENANLSDLSDLSGLSGQNSFDDQQSGFAPAPAKRFPTGFPP